jgi:hypothetical protein
VLFQLNFSKNNATVIGQDRYEDKKIRQLSLALKQQMLKEIRDG